MKKHKRKVKRASKLDRIVEATAQDYAHASTAEVVRDRTVMECALSVAEGKIVALTAEVAATKARRAELEAKLRGLALVVGKR